MDFDLRYEDYQFQMSDNKPVGFRQKDLTVRKRYDDSYLKSYRDIESRVQRLSMWRAEILTAFLPYMGRLLDFGCGLGHVVEAANQIGWNAWGYDLIEGEKDQRRLSALQIPFLDWDCVTFFDSLEHVPDPVGLIRLLRPRAVMISVPWCHRPFDSKWFMTWRHRRPGEHLWHWDSSMLDQLFVTLNYVPLMHSNFEDDWRNPTGPDANILTAIYRKKGETICDSKAA